MLRAFLVFVVVVAVSGIVPLMANGGSCADMPCCHRHGAVVTSTATDCCSPATCVKEQQAIHASTSTSQRHEAPVVVAVVPLATTIENRTALVPRTSSWSPPISTTERLSVLSILLI